MHKLTQTVVATSLAIIALSTLLSAPSKPVPGPTKTEEKVVTVIGRTSIPFDGFGADVGFLVKDGSDFRVLRYDSGSMASNKEFQPKYVMLTKFSDGKVQWDPVTVEPFN